jgi:bacterioferritin-associated ferredoxin
MQSSPPRQKLAVVCDDRMVCHCLGVRESELLEVLADFGVQTVADLRRQTGAGDGCTACHFLLRKYLEKRDQASSSALPICSVK